MNILRIGDEVLWSGGWGMGEEKPATVIDIMICEREDSKEGEQVSAVPWCSVNPYEGARKVIVTLDNDKWAWGFQIRKGDTNNA